MNAARFSRRPLSREKKGFTLIEIMVALSVLSISLVILLGLRNRSIALAAKSRHTIEATLLARQKITEISISGFPDLGESEGDFGNEYPLYRWRKNVVQTPFEEVREMFLEIIWKNNDQKENISVTTYLFDDKTRPGRRGSGSGS